MTKARKAVGESIVFVGIYLVAVGLAVMAVGAIVNRTERASDQSPAAEVGRPPERPSSTVSNLSGPVAVAEEQLRPPHTSSMSTTDSPMPLVVNQAGYLMIAADSMDAATRWLVTNHANVMIYYQNRDGQMVPFDENTIEALRGRIIYLEHQPNGSVSPTPSEPCGSPHGLCP